MTDNTTAASAGGAPEHVIKLDPPLKIADIEYPELQLREPTVAQWMLCENLEGVAADIVAVSTITGIPQPLIEGMPMSAFAAASRWLHELVEGDGLPQLVIPSGGEKQFTLPLRSPVTWDGRTYAELILREPTAKEWREFDALKGLAADVRAISLASGVPELAIRQLKIRDLLAAGRWIATFFPVARASGGE